MKMSKENNKEKMVAFRIDEKFFGEISDLSKKMNISSSEVIRRALMEWMRMRI